MLIIDVVRVVGGVVDGVIVGAIVVIVEVVRAVNCFMNTKVLLGASARRL